MAAEVVEVPAAAAADAPVAIIDAPADTIEGEFSAETISHLYAETKNASYKFIKMLTKQARDVYGNRVYSNQNMLFTLGENTDILPWNPQLNKPGGIHFTTAGHLQKWWGTGEFIVKIRMYFLRSASLRMRKRLRPMLIRATLRRTRSTSRGSGHAKNISVRSTKMCSCKTHYEKTDISLPAALHGTYLTL